MLETSCEGVVGTSPHADQIRRFIQRAAASSEPIVLVGEPGVGKETIARRVHLESPRHKHPFLTIDCSLYYERELKREVFGCVGSGTTGEGRKGLFEFASPGTCYLSRIEELSAGLQQCLLGFLRTGCYRRLGDGREVSSHVRLMVSSDKNLAGFVEGGLFDESLYRSLSGFCFHLAPLRERPADVTTAALVLTANYSKELGAPKPPEFTEEALEALRCFPWPRNFDQLKEELMRLVETEVRIITPDNLSFEIAGHWMGQRGDPEVRKVLQELDGHIREFKVLSRLDEEFGDILSDLSEWERMVSRHRSFRRND